MRFIAIIIAISLIGCVSSADKARVAYQAARLDRAIALIDSGKITQTEEEDFIRAERKVWHALDNSINGSPLPPDMQGGK